MDSSRTRLAVQVGPAYTVAAIERDGHRSALLFGDLLTVPTPSYQDSGRDLVAAVMATRREEAEPVIAALAEHLQTVASQAGGVDAVVVTAPPGWGPRHTVQQLGLVYTPLALADIPALANEIAELRRLYLTAGGHLRDILGDEAIRQLGLGNTSPVGLPPAE